MLHRETVVWPYRCKVRQVRNRQKDQHYFNEHYVLDESSLAPFQGASLDGTRFPGLKLG
jgi:hypothetical protein